MKKLVIIFVYTIFWSCGDDFLDNPPNIGLTPDKLTDLASAQALLYGAYAQIRPFVSQSALYSAGMMRDVVNRNRGEYDNFYGHEIGTNMTSWQYTSGFTALGTVNKIFADDLANTAATDAEKSAVLADAHFLRALIYFDLNNYWGDPITDYTVPLLELPLSIDDRVSCAKTSELSAFIESEIENARAHFQEASSGISNYYAATALAARIYFFHEKYDSAYARANEVITSGQYSLESDVTEVFTAPGNSNEIIFKIMFNSVDGSGVSPSARIFEAYQASPTLGFYSMNTNGVAAEMIMDEEDSRYTGLYSSDDNYVYVEKYTTDQMHYQYIRLAEMHLTRAEANIMINGSVNQQDVDDINVLRNRAKPSSALTSIPTKDQALNMLFEDRTKELAFELGDHFLNTKRLKFGIIRTQDEGEGFKTYAEWIELLLYPFPGNEVDIHGLTRSGN
tara:strand:+ start:6580 stop:7929 length:1350 start_codon:yes stop_codon:yes gene_type:complete